jgi:hypothetical protein
MAALHQDFDIHQTETLAIIFPVLKDGNPMNLEGCTASFVASKNEGETVAIDKWAEGVRVDSSGTIMVSLSSSDTAGLFGDYDYQLTVYTPDKKVIIVAEGTATIKKMFKTQKVL